MNRRIVDIYEVGVLACSGFGGIAGAYKCLELCKFFPNKSNNYQYITVDSKFDEFMICSLCCVYGFWLGCVAGAMAGTLSPVIVPVYGLIKIRNRYVLDNEIKE
jgi:hypothetical protein